MAAGEQTAKASPPYQPASPWVAALNQLHEWDPTWAELAVKITTNPWTDGVLPRKFVELVSVGLTASRTNLNPEGTAPAHTGSPRGWGGPSGDLICSQVRVRHVHSFRQL